MVIVSGFAVVLCYNCTFTMKRSHAWTLLKLLLHVPKGIYICRTVGKCYLLVCLSHLFAFGGSETEKVELFSHKQMRQQFGTAAVEGKAGASLINITLSPQHCQLWAKHCSLTSAIEARILDQEFKFESPRGDLRSVILSHSNLPDRHTKGQMGREISTT